MLWTLITLLQQIWILKWMMPLSPWAPPLRRQEVKVRFVIPAKYNAIHVDKVARKMIEQAFKDENGLFILESDKLQ